MITVYTQPDCRPCKRVLDMFKEADIEVEVVDVHNNLFALDYVKRALQAKSVPVIETAEELILGYQPEQIKELIGRITSERA